MRWWGSVLVVLAVALASVPFEAGAQSRRPHQWWQSDEVTTWLDLSEEQAADLDLIYRDALPKMHESYHRLKAEERTLSHLIANMRVEEIDITRQIDRVEAARSELSKTRTLMVFRMYRVLDPAQRTALNEWMDLKPDNEGSGRSRSRCG